jgi:surfeit locus 1 family protein
MALRIGNRVFAPGVFATVLTIMLVIALASLGRWQLERMREKQALFDAFESGGGAAVHLSMVPPSAARRYQRVAAIGHYDSAHQLLLDNMTHDGRAGFHVLTPLVIDAGRSVLVDRGWVPLGATREQLPDVAVAEGDRTVVGRLNDLPAAGIELAAAPPSGPWPRVASYPKMDELVKLLQLPLYPKVLLLDADQPDGFVREWQPAAFPPERHLGYAITWFALAFTLLAIYVFVNLRPAPDAR